MNKRFLISLDALLDTRLGAMNKFSPNISGQMVEDIDYYKRVTDDFEKYGTGTTMMWRSVYNNRDLDVLSRSILTAAPMMIAEIIRDIYAQSIDNPVWHGAEVTINTYPYTLEQIDCDEIAIAIQQKMVPIDGDEFAYDVPFTTARISHEELDIDSIRENWEVIVMYDFVDWWEVNAPKLLKAERGASLTSLFVPALFKEVPDRKSLLLPDGGKLNPFDETRRYLSLYFQLHFWDAICFSVPCPFET